VLTKQLTAPTLVVAEMINIMIIWYLAACAEEKRSLIQEYPVQKRKGSCLKLSPQKSGLGDKENSP
jgi:hypothetical protein